MENTDSGILLNRNNISLQRTYFKQMLKLRGINVLHYSPRETSKTYNLHGELETFYNTPVKTACIFVEHPNQWTMKKFGWISELNEGTSLIQVPYDLEGLQAGSLFAVPSGLDNSTARMFRVLRMSNIAVYPAFITCEIAPIFVSEEPEASTKDFTQTDFNLLNNGDTEDDEPGMNTETSSNQSITLNYRGNKK